MTKTTILLMCILFFSLSGCVSAPQTKSTTSLTLEQAKVIAEKDCLKSGESLEEPGYYNENTKTWWFDANLKEVDPGCNPACVVSEQTQTAEINWRCTGLIEPSASEQIKQLFIEKYPDYAETLSVNISQEAENHVRGGVTFVEGQAGGNFLAAKVDGQWQIVYDGNGQIPCDLSKYDFPKEMLANCAD